MAGALRVFLDANILFSASRSAGAVRELLRQAEQAGHRLVADPYVVMEAQRNLERKVGPEALAVLQALISRMEISAVHSAGRPGLSLEWLPEKDRPVLVAAIALRCDVLVTGDKTHFGGGFGERREGVLVCSPAGFFEIL